MLNTLCLRSLKYKMYRHTYEQLYTGVSDSLSLCRNQLDYQSLIVCQKQARMLPTVEYDTCYLIYVAEYACHAVSLETIHQIATLRQTSL
jgi:hypothetical protein